MYFFFFFLIEDIDSVFSVWYVRYMRGGFISLRFYIFIYLGKIKLCFV